MLSDEEMEETIDKVVNMVMEQGTLNDAGWVLGYELDLEECSLRVLKSTVDGLRTVIEITDNISDPYYAPNKGEGQSYKEMRNLYSGTRNGLVIVTLIEKNGSDSGGNAPPPSRTEIRANTTEIRANTLVGLDELTKYDNNKFETLLIYAKQQLEVSR